ncbi:hypothetical protein SAMN06265222_10780 [Neorhodopirellula lusitana]|uniref:Uncharacterized protein n=1 Tax=Neorhodopirellula lusitana TaxID=445327 RepID=A0ABY1Q6M5_9BACT|nr:hypothetical protein SAMN06265222_10780 [Neorhodopirellula lusitana]
MTDMIAVIMCLMQILSKASEAPHALVLAGLQFSELLLLNPAIWHRSRTG